VDIGAARIDSQSLGAAWLGVPPE